jgi:hypothetical protein
LEIWGFVGVVLLLLLWWQGSGCVKGGRGYPERIKIRNVYLGCGLLDWAGQLLVLG